MAEKAEIDKLIKALIEKLNEVGPYIAEDWGGAVQMVLPDLNTGWLIKFAMDGTIESCDEKVDEDAAEGVLETDSDTLAGILNKTLVPMEVMSEGKIVVRKSLDALIKIFPAIM